MNRNIEYYASLEVQKLGLMVDNCMFSQGDYIGYYDIDLWLPETSIETIIGKIDLDEIITFALNPENYSIYWKNDKYGMVVRIKSSKNTVGKWLGNLYPVTIAPELSKPKKYYFVNYECVRTEWRDGYTMGSHTIKEQIIIDIHPIQFQLDCNKKYGFQQDRNGEIPLDYIGITHKEDYKITNWVELTKEEYDEFKGKVG